MSVYLGSDKVGTIVELDASKELLKGVIEGSLSEITIPDGVTKIKPYIFQSDTNLTNIVIPNSVIELGNYCFSYCSSLYPKFIMPDSVTTIGTHCFLHCDKLEEIVLSKNLNALSSYMCHYCGDLKRIKIPEKITQIPTYCFRYCTSLETIDIPNNIETLESYSFADCSVLKDVVVGTGLTRIGTYSFYNCKALENIKLNENILSITNYAFEGSGLTEIELPVFINTIGTRSFYNCTNLTKFVAKGDVYEIKAQAFQNCSNCLIYDFSKCRSVPALAATSAFTGINANAKIYVLDRLYDSWKTATNWSTYASYIYKASEMPDYVDTMASWVDLKTATPEQISIISEDISTNNLSYSQIYEKYGLFVGDVTDIITLNNGEKIQFQIIDFKHDDKSDGTGKAGITFQTVTCLKTTYAMNDTATNAGGYAVSKMNTETIPQIKALLPQEWQDVIKKVDKKSANGGSRNFTEVVTHSEDVFLLSAVEFDGIGGKASGGLEEGFVYKYWESGAAYNKRYDNNDDGLGNVTTNYWTRSCYTTFTDAFLRVYSSSSSIDQSTATTKMRISFAFCV